MYKPTYIKTIRVDERLKQLKALGAIEPKSKWCLDCDNIKIKGFPCPGLGFPLPETECDGITLTNKCGKQVPIGYVKDKNVNVDI